jgi:hypothetical protein
MLRGQHRDDIRGQPDKQAPASGAGRGDAGGGVSGGFLADAAVGASAAASSGALVQAYLSARHLPVGSAAGIRVGSLHTASVAGATWAIADFTPSASAAPGVQAEFQDGAGTGIFRQVPGQP